MLKEANKVAESISKKYLEEGKDPTDELAKVASKKGWGPRKINIVSNKLNTKTISSLHKEAAQGDRDPYFTFPKVKTEDVVKKMEKSASKRPGASVPKPQNQTQLDKIFPDVEQTSREETVTTLDSDHLDMDRTDKADLGYIARVVDKLEGLLSRKRSKKAQLDQKINNLNHKLRKKASEAIRWGQPIDILDHIPVDKESMREKLASQRVDIQEADREIEMKEDNPLSKLAEKIEQKELERDEAIVELKEAEEKLEYAKTKLKNNQ